MIVAYACDSHLQMALTDLPSYVCVSKGLVHCMQPLLGCFILSPVYVVLVNNIEEPGVSAWHHSISEPKGSGSIFITGVDNHHAMYNSMTVNPLSSSFTEKIHSSRDHLGLDETAVEVLFGSSSILGWMESFGLNAKFQSW